ncbi:SMC family ATPase [Pyrobaculum aerophilum]|uniref:SMC family ATPase n=1 Tax=Pyrobaculum aerophilum TaxID=13773 RepID=UPI002FD96902
MWRIERIEVENFRSYRGRHIVALGDVNILHGRIGAGKTSLLYAVEYALYGRQLEVKERVAKLQDLINTESQEMGVVLTLRNGDRVLRIERRLGRRSSEKVVVNIDGVELRGKDAEEKLAELLGADEDVYERLVYISHRTLEGFIYVTSQKRSLTVDRLFGIDVIDGVVRTISGVEKELMEKAEELRKRLAAYEKHKDIIRRYGGFGQLKARLDSLAGEINALKEREERLAKAAEELAKKRANYLSKLQEQEPLLLEYYRVRSELQLLEEAGEGSGVDLSIVERLRDALLEAVEEFEHFFGQELAERLRKAGDLETLSVAMAEAYDALVKLQKELEEQVHETKRLYEHYETRARKIEVEIGDAEAKLKRLEKSYRRFKDLQKAYQSLENAKLTLSQLKRKLEEAERSAAFISALKTVASYAAEVGMDKCPICGAPLRGEELRRLQEEIETRGGSLIRELEEMRERVREVEKAVEEMEALSGEVAEYLAVKTRVEELKIEREEVVKKAVQAEKSLRQLEKKLERLRTLLAKVDKRTISEALSKYGRALRVRELRRRLKELEEELKKAGVVTDALNVDLNWREVVEELERTSSRLAEAYKEKSLIDEVIREVGEDSEVLRKKLDNALYAYSKLQEIKAKLELVRISARARLLEVAKSRFNEIFTSLYKYGDIVRVDADLEQRKGFYDFYAITSTGDKYGISKLSDGQRLSIALALALALRDIVEMNIGFIIFDEPIPYVDANIRKAFAEIVKSIADKLQLIIATQSREFAELIKTAVPNALLLVVDKKEHSSIVAER